LKIGEATSRYYLKDGRYHYLLINANGYAHSVNIQIMIVQTLGIVFDQIDKANGFHYSTGSESR
jgi:hypothetical protein